jgi:heme exporter protein A
LTQTAFTKFCQENPFQHESCLEISGLSCERGFNLLFSNLDFTLNQGAMALVWGPNGSGKTTLLRALAGIHHPLHGDIHWNGDPVNRRDNPLAGEISYVGHKSGLRQDMTPLENLEFFSRLASARLALTPRQSLAMTGSMGFQDLPCYQLSAGQSQRVTLARLCLARARLWLLDEPATALDRDGIRILESIMFAHICAGGLIVYTSHQKLDPGPVDVQTVNLPAASE